MRKIAILSFIFLTVALISCNNRNKNGGGLGKDDNDETRKVLYVNEIEPNNDLIPISITDAITSNVAYQIYEGLVRFNPKTLEAMPSIAEKWDIDASGTKYTFTLRKNVSFQDDPCFPEGKGRIVTASDFKYSFELLCSQHPKNYNFGLTFKGLVKGANAYYDASANGKPAFDLEGVKVISDNVLEITLESPSPFFLKMLCTISTSVVAKEAYEKYGLGMRIGTGPFMYVQSENPNEKIFLVKNPNYYRTDSAGVKLPYLDTICVSFISTKQAELDKFKNGNLDIVIGLPSESINEFLSEQIKQFENKPPKYILERSPEMVTQFYEMNLSDPTLKKLAVRKALNYAVDREKIVSDVLKDQAYGPGINGIVPPTFKGYATSVIKGYGYDPEKAKRYLAEAGYPNGKGFPTLKLELNSGGSRNTNVALEVQKQLQKTLNVNIEFEVLSLAKKMENAKMGKGQILRTAWVADYPSPINFLMLGYSKTLPDSPEKPSYPNTTRYNNAEFDKILELGMKAKSLEEQYELFGKAEQILMDDCPFIVLWYDENYKITKSNVHNFHFNPMNYKYYAEVSFREPLVIAAAKK
jgi:oligopeptide transport system substrate-binding protein